MSSGAPIAASARYSEPYGWSGQLLFHVVNSSGGVAASVWSPLIASGATARVTLPALPVGNYTLAVFASDGQLSWAPFHTFTVATAPPPSTTTTAGPPSSTTSTTGLPTTTTTVPRSTTTTVPPTTSTTVDPCPSYAPTSVTASPGDTRVTVEWVASSCGATTASTYTVTAHPGGQSTTTGAEARSTLLFGLTNGQSYTFVVTAMNGRGETQDSPESSPVVPSGKPNPPETVTASPDDGRATVTWSTADPNGASPITEYKVTASSGAVIPVPGDQTSLEFSPLQNHHRVTFTVAASNANGEGFPSHASNEVTPMGPVTGSARAFTKSFVEDPVHRDVTSLRNELSWNWDGICTRDLADSDSFEGHFGLTQWQLDLHTIDRSQEDCLYGTEITSTAAWHNDFFCLGEGNTTLVDLRNSLLGRPDGRYSYTWNDEVRGGCSSLLLPLHADGYMEAPTPATQSAAPSSHAEQSSRVVATPDVAMPNFAEDDGWEVAQEPHLLSDSVTMRIVGEQTPTGCQFSGTSEGGPGIPLRVTQYLAINLNLCEAYVQRGSADAAFEARLTSGS